MSWYVQKYKDMKRKVQNHQKEERERRKAGDIYKHCGTARPIKPSEGREGERRKPGDIYKRCDIARPIKSSEGRERERESFCQLKCLGLFHNRCYTQNQVCLPYYCYIKDQVCFHNHCHNKPFKNKYT